MCIYDPKLGNLLTAKAFYDAGLNIIPIRADGSKAPCIKHKPYHEKRYPWSSCQAWFSSRGRPHAIGILCGAGSKGLEVIDFDLESATTFPAWFAEVGREHPALLPTLPIVQTPKGGRHVYYRCAVVEGNQKLAEDEQQQTLIETRGQGGYVVAPGSPGSAHPTGRQYLMVQGSLLCVPSIAPAERKTMLDVARNFNRHEKKPRPIDMSWRYYEEEESESELCGYKPTGRPGDDLAAKVTWAEILEPHGWTHSHRSAGVEYWQRPDKCGKGCSASVNYAGAGLLYVFSTNAAPFVAGESYTKFGAFSMLNHHGDYELAAHALAEEGYGQVDLDLASCSIGGFDD